LYIVLANAAVLQAIIGTVENPPNATPTKAPAPTAARAFEQHS
jgi:hypothetical protein